MDAAQDRIKEISSVKIDKGCWMKNYVNESKDKHSIGRTWSLTTYDGERDSPPLVVPAHWHKHHDEYLTIVEGSLEFTLEAKKSILSHGDNMIVPANHIHGFSSLPGKKFVLKEATNPTGDFKEHFFLDVLEHGAPVSFWRAARAAWDGDLYPAIPIPWWLGRRFLDQAIVFVFGGLAKLLLQPRKPIDQLRQKNK